MYCKNCRSRDRRRSSRDRDRRRSTSRDRHRDRDRGKDKEKERERKRKGLPEIKKEHLSGMTFQSRKIIKRKINFHLRNFH